ncbi:MAG: ubiquitin-like domain-containing protein [Bacteroidota bacterium]
MPYGDVLISEQEDISQNKIENPFCSTKIRELKTIELVVRANKRFVRIETFQDSLVLSIKKKIENKFPIPCRVIKLFFIKEELDFSRSIEYYGIRNGARLRASIEECDDEKEEAFETTKSSAYYGPLGGAVGSSLSVSFKQKQKAETARPAVYGQRCIRRYGIPSKVKDFSNSQLRMELNSKKMRRSEIEYSFIVRENFWVLSLCRFRSPSEKINILGYEHLFIILEGVDPEHKYKASYGHNDGDHITFFIDLTTNKGKEKGSQKQGSDQKIKTLSSKIRIRKYRGDTNIIHQSRSRLTNVEKKLAGKKNYDIKNIMHTLSFVIKKKEAKALLIEVRKDENSFEEEPPPFNLPGKNGLFDPDGNAYNCVTWGLEKVAMATGTKLMENSPFVTRSSSLLYGKHDIFHVNSIVQAVGDTIFTTQETLFLALAICTFNGSAISSFADSSPFISSLCSFFGYNTANNSVDDNEGTSSFRIDGLRKLVETKADMDTNFYNGTVSKIMNKNAAFKKARERVKELEYNLNNLSRGQLRELAKLKRMLCHFFNHYYKTEKYPEFYGLNYLYAPIQLWEVDNVYDMKYRHPSAFVSTELWNS